MTSVLATKPEKLFQPQLDRTLEMCDIQKKVKKSFKIIAPFWPLRNLIAVNPLQGLEDMPIEDAVLIGAGYFQRLNLPEAMEKINRESIKWLQAYFDEGQATISMPLREEGLYLAWRQLAVYDVSLHQNEKQKKDWLRSLPQSAEQAIMVCLLKLDIPPQKQELFFTLMLSTLSGWSSYVKYRTEWAENDFHSSLSVNQEDYLALRLIITTLLWPQAKDLLNWHEQNPLETETTKIFAEIEKNEVAYGFSLLKKLSLQALPATHTPKAQVVFCIDARSERFRRALESVDDYQTFGFAGFFGLPVQIQNIITGESYASCPVLLSPKHVVTESPCSPTLCHQDYQGYAKLTLLKRLYQSVKYTFTTPFALVESLGLMSGLWMGLRTLSPGFATKVKLTLVNSIRKAINVEPCLDDISFIEQADYAEQALSIMGLTHHFAPLVVFCGHGSSTQNNAYATALDCGACGGRHGASNARVLATILNQPKIKEHLIKKGIHIPDYTNFIAAEHNTTTDEVTLYEQLESEKIRLFQESLERARILSCSERLNTLQKKGKVSTPKAVLSTWLRSQDWAQVRPEWGLARNAAFIVAPRSLTESLNLEGRSFLHSYDYKSDLQCRYLTTILTAPMVVAQWINAQYLFSTLDNVAYGSGSKVTQNITGKIGIMQGNASDLMTGLPLQSVYKTDIQPYHELQRLLTIVYAPREFLNSVIHSQPILQKLLGNGWVKMACIEPNDQKVYFLKRDFIWQKIN